MRRLVVASALLILVGLALLLPSVPLVSLLTKGTVSSGSSSAPRLGQAVASSTGDTTTTIGSLVGFGMVGVGLILEIFSLFTDVGPTTTSAEPLGERKRA